MNWKNDGSRWVAAAAALALCAGAVLAATETREILPCTSFSVRAEMVVAIGPEEHVDLIGPEEHVDLRIRFDPDLRIRVDGVAVASFVPGTAYTVDLAASESSGSWRTDIAIRDAAGVTVYSEAGHLLGDHQPAKTTASAESVLCLAVTY